MLYILCGHGHGDSGACGYGYQEQERVRVLANRMKAIGGNKVTVYRPDLDPYGDGVLNWISVGASDKVIELHLDSGSSSASGGHVIIKQGFDPDADDNRLANFISGMFPGRSQIIVGRSDLGNVNTAAARGINYRLLECCFISNYSNITKFNDNIDAIAKGILTAMGIKCSSKDKQGAWQKQTMKDGTVKWWWKNADGSFPKNDWLLVKNDWYYFDKNGWMVTGWVSWKKEWYYCNKSGKMVRSKMFKPEGDSRTYYVDKSGKMVKNQVIEIDGKDYAFMSDGRRAEKMADDGSLIK